ncbi:MAG: hypothetical protein M3N29_01400 [Chloroflexota bacterium]|nr:hypothetical protein [Chloroflexota bacterium]
MALLSGKALLVVVLVAAGCFSTRPEPGPDACVPVDVGGECFAPGREGFIDHALESTRAWPQLAGLPVEADEVIEGFDEAAGQPTWIVPIRVDGKFVAASRFLPFRDQVRLGEIALYLPPRDDFPIPAAAERLVIFTKWCGDPMPETCLFTEYGWRIEPSS